MCEGECQGTGWLQTNQTTAVTPFPSNCPEKLFYSIFPKNLEVNTRNSSNSHPVKICACMHAWTVQPMITRRSRLCCFPLGPSTEPTTTLEAVSKPERCWLLWKVAINLSTSQRSELKCSDDINSVVVSPDPSVWCYGSKSLFFCHQSAAICLGRGESLRYDF